MALSCPGARSRAVVPRVSGLLLAMLAAVGCGPSTPSVPAGGPSTPVVPRRIVSLAPSHTELLFALGAGDRVVGTTRFCDRPPEAAGLPRVADARTVRLEALAALDPDLIVANAEALEDAVAPLRGRVPFLLAPTDSLEDLLAAPLILGDAVGRSAEGRTLRASMDEALAAARLRGKHRAGTRVLFVVQREPFFVAGPGSFTASLLEVLGCTNVAGGLARRWPTISAEALLTLAPDVVIDASPEVTGEVAEADFDAGVRAWWARFSSLPAVKNGRVVRLRDEAAVRPGPALAAALDALERTLDPGSTQTPAGGADGEKR